MAKGLKFLLVGAVLGLMAVFSVIGVKSMLDDRNAMSLPEKTRAILNEQQQTTIPQTNATGDPSLADKPATQAGDGTAITPTTQQGTNTQAQVAVNTPETTSQPQANNQQQQPNQTQENVTQSTEQEEKLDMQLIDEYGGLQLKLSDPANPGQLPKGEFIIRDAQDQVVAHMKDTDTASFDLSPGIYEVTVIAKGKKSARMVNIVTGEFVTEHFTLPGGSAAQVQQAQQQNQQQPAQQNNQQPNQQQTQNSQQQTQPPANMGRLAVVVQTAGSNAPLKSNIYVQLPNGTLVTKKNYADFANFDLKPGTYKVTVKAPGKVDEIRNVEIRNGHGAQAVFSMKSPAAQTQNNNPPPPQEGTLRLVLQSPANAQTPRRGRFVIQDANGKRVTRMRGVSNAEVKLKPGRYNVIAVFRGSRISKPVTINKGQVSNIVFNAGEFPQPAQTTQQQNQTAQQSQQQVQVPAQQGVLQLIAVDGVTRQPLKVDFMVSTLNGQRLKRAENVSVTEVAMAPQAVLVDISYQEMRGQERIQVKAGEPTVYTFTITPNTPAPINQQQQAPRSLEEMLLERLQQELLQRLN